MQKNLYVVHQHFYHFKKCSLTSEDSKPGKVLFGTNWKVNRSSSSAILVVYSCMRAQPLSQGLSTFNRPPAPPKKLLRGHCKLTSLQSRKDIQKPVPTIPTQIVLFLEYDQDKQLSRITNYSECFTWGDFFQTNQIKSTLKENPFITIPCSSIKNVG